MTHYQWGEDKDWYESGGSLRNKIRNDVRHVVEKTLSKVSEKESKMSQVGDVIRAGISLELKPMSVDNALAYFELVHSIPSHHEIDFAISVVEDATIRGVIAMKADGLTCELAHLFTDGTALVGSLLYGAAWRAAKALGYETITL